ncbi:MAG: SDR family oxidoreductase [Myxococcaceae bacterium]|nr:SDR family oxidoreductase [Myxococcaceae bacterium]
MRVAVTGSNGLVGRRLVARLVSAGHTVLGLSRGARRVDGAFEYAAVDLADTDALTARMQAFAPDVILNPGGMTDVDGCERDPKAAWAANVTGVATLALCARALDAHLVHVSTDYVFDGDDGPYAPDAKPNPRGTYAVTKAAGELAVKALLPPAQWTIARTAVVSGWPSTGKNNFGFWLISTIAKGQPAPLFEDQWVSTSHATNVAAMLAELAERRLSGLWHTCGAEVTSRVEFGRRLCERFGFDGALITPSRMADVKLLSPRPRKTGLRVDQTAAALSAKPWTVAQTLDALWNERQETP